MNHPTPPLSAKALQSRYDQLLGQRNRIESDRDEKRCRAEQLVKYLSVAPKVEAALDLLSQELFGKLVAVIEKNLTLALQEVLGQPILLKVDRDFKRGAVTMRFHIERDGQTEDIMKGQGGSVANILSVGLRIFAMAQLDSKLHRKFLVLDEQDCWLAPDLVPRLARIVRDVSAELGYQVIMISHHSLSAFDRYADKIIHFLPTPDGIQTKDVTPAGINPDI